MQRHVPPDWCSAGVLIPGSWTRCLT
jgi:hypothetical protein